MRSHSSYVTGRELGRAAMPIPACIYLIAWSVAPDIGDANVDVREMDGGEDAFGESSGAMIGAVFEMEEFDAAGFGGDDPDFGDAKAGKISNALLFVLPPWIRLRKNLHHQLRR